MWGNIHTYTLNLSNLKKKLLILVLSLWVCFKRYPVEKSVVLNENVLSDRWYWFIFTFTWLCLLHKYKKLLINVGKYFLTLSCRYAFPRESRFNSTMYWGLNFTSTAYVCSNCFLSLFYVNNLHLELALL